MGYSAVPMLRFRDYFQSYCNQFFNCLSPTKEIHHSAVLLLNAYNLDYSLSMYSMSAIPCSGVNKVHLCCTYITLNITKTARHVSVNPSASLSHMLQSDTVLEALPYKTAESFSPLMRKSFLYDFAFLNGTSPQT